MGHLVLEVSLELMVKQAKQDHKDCKDALDLLDSLVTKVQ